tara:strand:- start:79 stop:2295 length:2217 start_codon:yes stop_codon:yes gene_type:complete
MGVNKKGGLVGGFDQLRAPDAPTISSVAVGTSQQLTVTITNPTDTGGGDITGYAVSALTGPIEDTTFAVTVVSSGGNKYAIDGSTQGTVTLHKGHTYIFDQSDSSNSGHPLRLSTTSNGTHSSGSEYTTGVTTSGTPGSAGAFTKIAVSSQDGSTVFDGTDDWLSISASNDFDISDGEVTYEGWVYFDNSVSNFQVKQCIWEHYTDDNNLARLFFDGGNGNVLRLTIRSGGTNLLNAKGTTTISADTWYHIAVTRSTSGDWETFINGTKDNGASGSESSALDTSGMTFYLGVDFWNVDRFLLGNISNFRIVKGTRVYTSNFTAPTGPLTAITNTVLLTCTNPSGTITDLSSSNHSITVNSGAAASSTNPFSDTLYYYCTNHSGMGGTANLKASLQGGASGSSSPITVSSLTDGESYNVRASAINAFGQSPYSDATSGTPTEIERGVFAGGSTASSQSDFIEYITITSTGNSTEFGNLQTQKSAVAGCASSTRGIFGGGHSTTNQIDYITILSTGNASDFGDLSVARRYASGLSNSTRGVFGGGSTGSNSDVIDYITIASTGNATDFGNMQNARQATAGCASTTRGIIFGGDQIGGQTDTIDYITIGSTGNASDFGDLTTNCSNQAAFSSSTRGINAGGSDGSGYLNVISYVTIASTGNATDFGDLLSVVAYCTGCAGSTRGIIAGGYNGSAAINVIQYITIASTGNSTDFGDLNVDTDGWGASYQNKGGCSNSHGGLS